MSRTAFRDDPVRQIDTGEMMRVMVNSTACTCRYEPEDVPGGYRVPNLRCLVHGLADAASEALGRLL